MRYKTYVAALAVLVSGLIIYASTGQETDEMKPTDMLQINCGNLVYAENQTSVCFADAFLARAADATTLDINPRFARIALDKPAVFDYPFCVFSGEGTFTLTARQRKNFRKYLLAGGFILASPGCSDEEWDKSFRTEIKLIFPDYSLQKIPANHSVFSVVHNIPALHDKSGKKARLEGLVVDGRIVMIYSKEGLNDVGNADGCCCCGGNEIRESQDMNVNVITYSLLY